MSINIIETNLEWAYPLTPRRYAPNEGMRQLLLAMRRRELPLTEAMAINDDAKAQAEAAAGKCDVPANDEYLGRCACEMGEILELETDT